MALNPASTPLSLSDAASEPVIGRRQAWFAGSVIMLLLLGGAVATPYADMKMIPVPGYLPMFSAAMIIINFLLATLLFIKGTIEQRGDTIRLGAAYLFVCLIIFPQTASFPGGLMQIPLIGAPATPVWIWSFWHTGFGFAIIYYAWCTNRPTPPSASLVSPILMALLATAVATLIATVWVHSLPPLLIDGQALFSGVMAVVPFTALVTSVLALYCVARLRSRSPEQLWLIVGMVASCIDIWLTWHGTVRFSLGWYLAKAGSLVTSLAVMTSLFHEITRLYSQTAANNRALTELACRDGLTGVANRRYFDEMLQREFHRACRQAQPLGLVMVDVDCFKAYNDRYGHLAGDECLRRISQAIKGSLVRAEDLIARFGGEEFVVLLPATEASSAMVVAERLREAVAALHMEHLGSALGVASVSGGVSSFIPSGNADRPADLLSAADRALYQAKTAGRNRICRGAVSRATGPENSRLEILGA